MSGAVRRRVWVVGPSDTPEFQPLVAWLCDHTVPQFATGRETTLPELRHRRTTEGCAWVVFLSPRPESLERATIERWQQWLPLARLVVVLGSWCEGETRTGRPWPGVSRIYWHQILPRLIVPLADSHDGDVEARLPRTATEVERIEATLAGHESRVLADRRIAVWSPTRIGWEAVADAIRASGGEPIRWTHTTEQLPESIDAVVLDLPGSFDASDELWRNPAWQAREVPALAIVGFPRWEDHQASQQRGVSLLAKPWRLIDFQRQLNQLIAMNREQRKNLTRCASEGTL